MAEIQHERLGLFGGTFDPPHVGHLILASEARSQLDLTRVLWTVTPDPPHKQDQFITSLQHRLAMVRLAIQGDPRFEISDIELNRPGPHYTVDTIRLLAEQNPSAEIVPIIGGDSLHDLPTWHQPKELVYAAHWVGVMRRPGEEPDLKELERELPGISSKVHYVDAPLLEIASREIRSRVASGRPYRYYLPNPVYEYIQQNHLYEQSEVIQPKP
ncbi:MAG: nicotinate-nucleotide adenylyltransferase [Byssovorax cruenta]|jgi:nicotinate-nucleotide adenylyltransferase